MLLVSGLNTLHMTKNFEHKSCTCKVLQLGNCIVVVIATQGMYSAPNKESKTFKFGNFQL